MKAWLSRGQGVDDLRLEAVGVPSPGAGCALLQVHHAALNFSDVLMIQDKYQIRPPRPFIPGQEVAGIVVEAGQGSRLSLGDRVASKVVWGGFAPYAVVRDDMAMVLDPSADLAAAVALPVAYTTAWVGLVEEARIVVDDVLLVHGAAGGVGLAAVEVGRALGARVIATASTASKRALAQNHGADTVVDYGNAEWVEAVNEATDGSGVDIVFDTVGGTIGEESLRCMAWGGRFLVVGFASGAVPKLPGHRLLLRRLRAIGVYWNHDQDGKMLARVASQIGKLFSTGSIRPHLDRSHSFEVLPQALASLADRTTMGKVVLTISEAHL